MKLRGTTRLRLSRPRAGNTNTCRHKVHPVARESFSCPQATGVSDVNEVIQKMISQESTAESLMILTKENQVGRRQVSPDCFRCLSAGGLGEPGAICKVTLENEDTRFQCFV